MPNFPEESPQDYYEQEIVENEPEQVQEFQDIREYPVQQYQSDNQNQAQTLSYQTPSSNYSEDILLQSSLGVSDSNKTYATQILPNETEQTEIAPPIYQSAQVPYTNNINLGEYNDINTIKSYSYPVKNININNNQQFATVQPINNNIPFNEENNQYTNEVSPQYIQSENLIYSTPVQIKQNVISQNNNNINNINSTFTQSIPQITPISYVNSNSNFGSGFENEKGISGLGKGMKNLNLSDQKNEVTIKLTGKKNDVNDTNVNNNLNRTNFLKSGNPNNIKNLDKFSKDSWILFYPENDPFFSSLNEIKDTIPNQRIENPETNEIYIGEINRSKQRHGYGKLTTPDYEKEGTWKNNRFNGWGREARKNGEIYEGRFINDSLNGKGKYKKGNILYIGDFVNYEQHGKGELFTDEYHYTGDFKRNGFHGYGRIEIYDIGVYEGDFRNKEITGYGIFKYSNGDFYEGNLDQGKKEGYGKFITSDGKTYEGEFSNDSFVGNYNLRSKNQSYKRNDKY